MVTLSWVLGTSANLGIKEVRAVQMQGRVICGGPDPGFLAFCVWINTGFSMSWPVGQI